ncbi:MAG TPA: amidase family protein [Desulfosalsimonadaceae bacterium]|nr:amidase family protein [Desulfosalsimonadaceae bacterium]
MNSDIFTYQPESPLQESTDGLLAGRQILIQPDISVQGWLTDAGCQALTGYQAVMDATTIVRLKSAGASLIGSTRMAELGLGINDSTMAEAVCAGHGDLGLVTDLLGEARMTACLSGWFGYKPSYGLLSRFGLVGLIPSMECTGFLAQSPADIAKALSALAGPDENDFSMAPETPEINPSTPPEQAANRIGIPRQITDHLTASAQTAFSAGLEHAAGAGFEIIELDLPGFDQFAACHQIIAAAEASSTCGKYDGVRYGFRAEEAQNWNDMYIQSRGRGFGTRIKSFLFQGAYFQFENYPAFENACVLRQKLINRLNEVFESVHLLALPARAAHADPCGADTIEDTYAAFGLTLPANLAGLPALCLPGIIKNDETDLGLQLMGPHMADARVLAAGSTINAWIKGVGSK